MWTCGECKEEVEEYLEVCSGCGAYRDEVAAPRKKAPPRQLESETSRVSKHNMRVGACWFAGGAFVTLLSYQAAAPGGSYVVAVGAMGCGLIRFFVGFSEYGT